MKSWSAIHDTWTSHESIDVKWKFYHFVLKWFIFNQNCFNDMFMKALTWKSSYYMIYGLKFFTLETPGNQGMEIHESH